MSWKDVGRVVGVALSDWDMRVVTHELVVAEGNARLVSDIKFYNTLGKVVISAFHAAYLYGVLNTFTSRDMSMRLAESHKRIAAELFDMYGLQRFVLCGHTSWHGIKHVDAAYRLVAAVFRNSGGLATYDFLKPAFRWVMDEPKANPKQVVQEYAQARKLGLEYVTHMVGGTAHEPVFECMLTVGSRSVCGQGRRKKMAESAAADEFIKQYDVRIRRQPSEVTRKDRSYSSVVVVRKRMGDLVKLRCELGVGEMSISLRQLEVALTHKSWSSVHSGSLTDECLHTVGSYAMALYGCVYSSEVFSNDWAFMSKLSSQLLTDDYLSGAISDSVIDLCRVGSSFVRSDHSNYDRLKVDAFKSVLGAMWANYCFRRDEHIGGNLRDVMWNVFANGSFDMSVHYRSFVQEITQRYGLRYEETSNRDSSSRLDRPVFHSVTEVSGDGWSIKGFGTGGSIKSARNRALQSVVDSLGRRYPDDVTLRLINDFANPELQVFKDAVESIEDASKSNGRDSQDDLEDYGRSLAKGDCVRPKAFDRLRFTGSERVLHICKGTRSCRDQGHVIVCVTALFDSIGGRTVHVNVNYCEQCDIYFLGYREYRYYRDNYGGILGNYVFDLAHGGNGDRYDAWSDMSPLMECGYSVSQAQDLSTSQRHKILANAIDNGILSKARVIEYLQFFIANRESRLNMRFACEKWRSDLAWVRSYEMGSQRCVAISDVKRFRR